MGIFGKFIKSKTLKANDSDFGEIESLSIKGDKVYWQTKQKFSNFDIDVNIAGDKNGIPKENKEEVLNTLADESLIISESEKALREQFEDADMEFISLEKHFNLVGISFQNEELEVTFQEKEGNFFFFNVYFKNNEQIGVSIDG